MNYITEIKLFHDWLETHGEMTPAAVLLWYGLMFLTNKAGWRKGVALPMSRIGASRLRCFWPAAIRYALSPYQCLAAAIAPRRRKKSARRQFRPLGNAGGVMNPAQSSRTFNPVGLQTWFQRITNHARTRIDLSRSLELKPDADCGRGRLFPRFRLASRSAASGGSRSPFCTGTLRSVIAIFGLRR